MTGSGQRNDRRLVDGDVLLGVPLAVVVNNVTVAVQLVADALMRVVERQLVLIGGATEATTGERVERDSVGAVQHLAVTREVREVYERLATGCDELRRVTEIYHGVSLGCFLANSKQAVTCLLLAKNMNREFLMYLGVITTLRSILIIAHIYILVNIHLC